MIYYDGYFRIHKLKRKQNDSRNGHIENLQKKSPQITKG